MTGERGAASEKYPPAPNWMLSDVELDMRYFSETLGTIRGMEKGIAALRNQLRGQLQRWQEMGIFVPLTAQARYFTRPGLVDPDTQEQIPYRYMPGEGDTVQGWIPADRYRIIMLHSSATDGDMAWVQSQTPAEGISYDIVIDTIKSVQDADILRQQTDQQ